MNIRKSRRQQRIRKHIKFVSDRQRLSVHRSNQYLYAQIIDDKKGVTLVGVSEKTLASKSRPIERAKELGALLAKMAQEKQITAVVFDKGRYSYHGRVKALADGAREGGLQF